MSSSNQEPKELYSYLQTEPDEVLFEELEIGELFVHNSVLYKKTDTEEAKRTSDIRRAFYLTSKVKRYKMRGKPNQVMFGELLVGAPLSYEDVNYIKVDGEKAVDESTGTHKTIYPGILVTLTL